VGGTAEQPTQTFAGTVLLTLPNIGNLSFATAGSSATTAGVVNLAASFGGTGSALIAIGVGNDALNLGSHNSLTAAGYVNNATVLFGDGNIVEASNPPGPGAGFTGVNLAFNVFGDNNRAVAGPGPGALAGLIGVNDQNGPDSVTNSNFGIEPRTPFNEVTPPPLTSTALAGGNKVAPTTFAARSVNRAGSQLSGSLPKATKQFNSSLNSLSKKVADTVNKVGFARGTKAGAASTSGSSSGGSSNGGASAS
jgi:hypothetical protein